jgi:two-component system, response regulator PdtaR
MVSPRLRILIVEDHQILAVGLELLLARLGHEAVAIVDNGTDAIAAAERHRPDFIFMDVGLEGDMDGIDAAQEIRTRFGIRSLFFTGLSDPKTRERAALAEPIAFLDKASPKTELARVIGAFSEELSRGSPRRGK